MLEKLQSMLNFTNSDGEVITFFNGSMTIGQLIIIIVAIIIILAVLKLIKGVIKFAVTGAIVIFALIQFGIASPDQLKNVASTIQSQGIAVYEQYQSASDFVKIEDGKVYVSPDKETWVDVTTIKSIVQGEEGTLSITDGKNTYAITDETAQKMLKTFAKK